MGRGATELGGLHVDGHHLCGRAEREGMRLDLPPRSVALQLGEYGVIVVFEPRRSLGFTPIAAEATRSTGNSLPRGDLPDRSWTRRARGSRASFSVAPKPARTQS